MNVTVGSRVRPVAGFRFKLNSGVELVADPYVALEQVGRVEELDSPLRFLDEGGGENIDKDLGVFNGLEKVNERLGGSFENGDFFVNQFFHSTHEARYFAFIVNRIGWQWLKGHAGERLTCFRIYQLCAAKALNNEIDRISRFSVCCPQEAEGPSKGTGLICLERKPGSGRLAG